MSLLHQYKTFDEVDSLGYMEKRVQVCKWKWSELRPGLCLYPGQLFLILMSIWPSETQYQCIVKICHLSGEFTGVDFSRDKASVTARLKPMNHVHV